MGVVKFCFPVHIAKLGSKIIEPCLSWPRLTAKSSLFSQFHGAYHSLECIHVFRAIYSVELAAQNTDVSLFVMEYDSLWVSNVGGYCFGILFTEVLATWYLFEERFVKIMTTVGTCRYFTSRVEVLRELMADFFGLPISYIFRDDLRNADLYQLGGTPDCVSSIFQINDGISITLRSQIAL